jgi:hypothetical protein
MSGGTCPTQSLLRKYLLIKWQKKELSTFWGSWRSSENIRFLLLKGLTDWCCAICGRKDSAWRDIILNWLTCYCSVTSSDFISALYMIVMGFYFLPCLRPVKLCGEPHNGMYFTLYHEGWD